MAHKSVRMVCTDTGNLWQTSNGRIVNRWLDPVVGGAWAIYIPAVDVGIRMIPFDGGKTGAGVKPYPEDCEMWRRLCFGASNANPLVYDAAVEFVPFKRH